MIPRLIRAAARLVVLITLACCAAPPPAAAIDLTKPVCSVAGLVSPLAGKICTAGAHPGRLVGAGKKLLGGHLGGAVNSLLGDGASGATKAATLAGFAAIAAAAVAGAGFAMHETAKVVSSTTRPELQSTWFSTAYWRMAGISALLTLPFLFAAAIQSLLRSELALLWRAAFGYLPLGLLSVAIAAPVTMLLLSASDEMSGLVSSASGGADTDFLMKVGAGAGGLSLISRSPFLAFVVALLTAAATLTLWTELLVRAAAVYAIVLMLPLFFAALVWPARRVWAVRAIELLVALILSKFAIVAVLSLGGAALGHTTVPSFTSMLAGATLILLAAFAPWALLRMLPLHELAAGAAAGLHHEPQQRLAVAAFGGADRAAGDGEPERAKAGTADDRAADAAMRRLASHGTNERDSGQGDPGPAPSGDVPGAREGSAASTAMGGAPPAEPPVPTGPGQAPAGDALAGDPLAGDPPAGDPPAGDALAGDALAGDALAGEPAGGAGAGVLATAVESPSGAGRTERRPGIAEIFPEDGQPLHLSTGAEETIGPITWPDVTPAGEADGHPSPGLRSGEDHERLPPDQESDGGRL